MIIKSGLDPFHAQGLPGYPLPSILLSRLAIEKSQQGKGYGPSLLKWVFSKAVEISADDYAPSFRFVHVDAIDQNAKKFYEKYGFKTFIDKPMSLYISLETIKASIG
ncbi:MAG: GNAT family N-acetyltransferase [Oligoflexus sp.]|nr:GNAT family N-acetyltransferase [Oligoflexus sp.]